MIARRFSSRRISANTASANQFVPRRHAKFPRSQFQSHCSPPVGSRNFRVMKYRRFGRTELSMPVISCGGMRYQFKWQDVDRRKKFRRKTRRISKRPFIARWNSESTTSKQRAAMAHPKCSWEMFSRQLPREKIIVQTKVAPSQAPHEFLETFDRSMKYLKLDYVDLAFLHGINNRELLNWSLQKERLCRCRAPASEATDASASSAFPRTLRPTSFWTR